MRTIIYKYKIPNAIIPTQISFELPKEAKFLSCKADNNDIVLWFEIDLDNSENLPKVKRTFYNVWTGHEFHKSSTDKYLGTVEVNVGLVYHLYEKITV